MAQLLNLGATLGASKTGLAVGYRLLNMNGTTQAAFSTSSVVEGSIPGTYVVTVPVSVADAGARIIWGVSGTDYASGVIDAVPTVNLLPGAITGLGLIPAASAGSSNVAGTLSVVRASTFEAVLSNITVPAGWTSARFTVKTSGTLTLVDTTAIVQILVSNPGAGGDGLKVLKGAVPGTPTQAGLVVDAGASTVAIRIDDDITAQLDTETYTYDVKFFYTTSKSGPPYVGLLRVSATPTQTFNAA